VGVAAPGGSAAGAGGPASKFRRTCNLHACGLGVACRELRAIGLTGDGYLCRGRSGLHAARAVKVAGQAEMPFPRWAVDRTEDCRGVFRGPDGARVPYLGRAIGLSLLDISGAALLVCEVLPDACHL
jgi:hypothetical protein